MKETGYGVRHASVSMTVCATQAKKAEQNDAYYLKHRTEILRQKKQKRLKSEATPYYNYSRELSMHSQAFKYMHYNSARFWIMFAFWNSDWNEDII